MESQLQQLDLLHMRQVKLRAELQRVQSRIGSEKRRLSDQKYGIMVGSVVSYQGQEYRVADIDNGHWPDRPVISGFSLDGDNGDKEDLGQKWHFVRH